MKPSGNRQDADFSCKAEGHRGRVTRATLYRVLAALLIVIAAALTWSHLDPLNLQPAPRTILGDPVGVGVGIGAALIGVAGGEPLIPTITLLER
jgi:uncharacterized protein